MGRSGDGKVGYRQRIDTKNGVFGVYLVEDRGSGFVEGDPDAATGTGSKVHTSGNWVFEWTATALGGSLPTVKYPGGTAR